MSYQIKNLFLVFNAAVTGCVRLRGMLQSVSLDVKLPYIIAWRVINIFRHTRTEHEKEIIQRSKPTFDARCFWRALVLALQSTDSFTAIYSSQHAQAKTAQFSSRQRMPCLHQKSKIRVVGALVKFMTRRTFLPCTQNSFGTRKFNRTKLALVRTSTTIWLILVSFQQQNQDSNFFHDVSRPRRYTCLKKSSLRFRHQKSAFEQSRYRNATCLIEFLWISCTHSYAYSIPEPDSILWIKQWCLVNGTNVSIVEGYPAYA